MDLRLATPASRHVVSVAQPGAEGSGSRLKRRIVCSPRSLDPLEHLWYDVLLVKRKEWRCDNRTLPAARTYQTAFHELAQRAHLAA